MAAHASAADDQELPQGPNRALVYGKCRTCHDLQYLIESAGIPRDAWNDIIDSMGQYGLQITPEQRAQVLEYLATYLGPTPPPAAANAPASAPAAKADGAKIYEEQCVSCHQAKGEGVPGTFPPLAKNRDIFLSRDFPAQVVLFGMSSKIKVNGKDFDSMMPPLAEVLNDEEIAAVVNYIRSTFGNAGFVPKNMKPIDAAAVAALRARKSTLAGHTAEERKRLETAPRK
jgi:mono/diheme cytochrome c family protein